MPGIKWKRSLKRSSVGANDSTPDTPQERDEKADELKEERIEEARVLRIEREALAEIIRLETRRFRMEVRAYWIIIALILYINT